MVMIAHRRDALRSVGHGRGTEEAWLVDPAYAYGCYTESTVDDAKSLVDPTYAYECYTRSTE